MTIIEVENLSAADIKARWHEAVAAAKQSPDVADRYVQARFDAKMRDEKLSEQGKTIQNLNAAVESLTHGLVTAKAELQARADVLAAVNQELASLRGECATLTGLLGVAQDRARDRRAALADVMAFAGQLSQKVAPLLAQE